MTSKEYIGLYHEQIWPSLVNGQWTITGEEWYPCVRLDDTVDGRPGWHKIVTRNQTFLCEQPERVQAI